MSVRGCTYWVVWLVGGGSPTRTHDSEGNAESEARRLALANPGKTFAVLAAKTHFRVDDPVTRIDLDEAPF